jgi:hypothetical protein
VDRADLDASFLDQLRQPRALRAGEREVQPLRDTAREQVQVLRQREHRLHHVQVVHPVRVDFRQCLRQEIGLLLVVALEADAVARFDQGFQQFDGAGRLDPFSLCQGAGAGEAGGAAFSRGVPVDGGHRRPPHTATTKITQSTTGATSMTSIP